jgi:hypothetical protein
MAHAPLDLLDVLVADHRVLEGLFADIEVAAGDPERRRATVDIVIAELMRHATIEEQYLVPATRRYLAAGAELAEHELAEHAEAEEIMNRLMPLDGADPDFDPLVAHLIVELRHHLQEEETELFPRLRVACDHDTLVRLGTEALAVRALAPTRPHPAAPHHAPVNRWIAPLTGLADRAADALTDRKTHPR